MQALRLAVLLPFLGTSTPMTEPELMAVTLEAEDACAPGATAEECEMSFRQLRGERTITQHGAQAASSRPAQSALHLSSTVTESIDYSSRASYSVSDESSGNKLLNSFTETSDAAKWEFHSVILSLDAQPQMFETIDEKKPLGLRITMKSSLAGMLNPSCVVRVARLNSYVADTLTKSGTPSASGMPSFRMAAPACFGKPHCYARQPDGGFAEAPKFSADLPPQDVLGYNLTGVLDADHTSVEVFVVPTKVNPDGLWATEAYEIQNWRFFNLASSFDDMSGSDDDDEGWEMED